MVDLLSFYVFNQHGNYFDQRSCDFPSDGGNSITVSLITMDCGGSILMGQLLWMALQPA